MAIAREPSLRTFRPRWPAPAAIAANRVRFAYWHDVDTLTVDFFGEPRPAVSVPLDLSDGEIGYLYLRVDPTTEEVVGLQIENFMAYAVRRRPHLLELLDLAELHGITPTDVGTLRRDVAPTERKRTAVAALLADLAPRSAAPPSAGAE